ncbi:hypothetical protein V8G54_003205, partial [Vigna mungo]
MKFLSQGFTQSQSLGRHSLTLQRITRATVRILKPRSQSRKILPHEQTIMKNRTRADIRNGHLKLLGNGSTEDPPIPQTGGGSERREAHGCMSGVEIGLEGAGEGLGERNDEPGEQRVLGIGDEVLGKWCVEEGSLFDVVEESGGFKDLGIGFVSEEAGGDGENPEGGIDDNLGGNAGGGVGVGVDYLEAGAEND